MRLSLLFILGLDAEQIEFKKREVKMSTINDLQKRRDQKAKKEILDKLIRVHGGIWLDPWLVLYKAGERIEIFRDNGAGFTKIFKDEVTGG